MQRGGVFGDADALKTLNCFDCHDFDPNTFGSITLANNVKEARVYAIPDWGRPVKQVSVCPNPSLDYSEQSLGLGGEATILAYHCGGRRNPCKRAEFDAWANTVGNTICKNHFSTECGVGKDCKHLYHFVDVSATAPPTAKSSSGMSLWPVWIFLGLAVGSGSAYAVSKYTSSQPAQHRPEHYFESAEDEPIKAEAAPVSRNAARRQVELQQQQRQEESHHSEVRMLQEQRNYAPAIGVGS